MTEPAPYAVVLAAGAGSRFGGDKLLAPFRGRPLIAHVAATIAQAILAGELAGGVAIVPPRASALIWALETAGLRLIENRDTTSGLATSLRLGLAALDEVLPRAESALVVLADQPLLSVETIALLVAAWRRNRLSVRPRYARELDIPGHPVLLDRAVWPMTEGLTGDTGLGPLFRHHPESISIIDVPGANPDVDRPADLQSLEESR